MDLLGSTMESLRQLIYTSLDNELNDNAFFLSERLHAQYPTELVWVHMRSLACLRLGQPALAADYCRDEAISGRHLGCSYVFAQACLRIGRAVEGITALKAALSQQAQHTGHGSNGDRYVPDESALHRLLGKLYMANADVKNAASHLATSLQCNPFMWDSFTELCDAGIPLQLENIFRFPAASAEQPSSGTQNSQRRKQRQTAQTSTQVLSTTKSNKLGDDRDAGTNRKASRRLHHTDTTAQAASAARKPQNKSNTKPGLDKSPAGNVGAANKTPTAAHHNAPRRSTRLKSRPPADLPASARRATVSGLDDPFGPSSASTHHMQGQTSPSDEHVAQDYASVAVREQASKSATTTTPSRSDPRLKQLLSTLKTLGTAYLHLSQFRAKECMSTFHLLPIEQQASPWILSKVGRAQYEMQQYSESKTSFQVLRATSPAWTQGLEVYSTVLWHLKEDVELALLAHQLTDTHYLSAETWCAVGNSFSLQGSRDDAIKSFRRACQLEPPLAHAYSLLGCEYLETEEYTDATRAFRRALQIDNRHYPAWVGLGRVQDKLGRSTVALNYLLKAAQLNSHNAVLMSHIARTLRSQGKHQLALTYLARGAALDPPKAITVLINMQAAAVYLHFHQPQQALRSLLSVKHIASDEPQVHFLLGKAYAMAGPEYRTAALQSFVTASSLDPRNDKITSALVALQGTTVYGAPSTAPI